MPRLVVLISLLGACASRPAPVPVEPPPAQPAPVPPPAPVVAPASAPASLLELANRADLNLLAIVEAEACAPRTWIISALDSQGAGASCVGDGSSEPRCILFAGTTADHLNDVMCRQRGPARAAPVPAWAPDVFGWMHALPADQSWQVSHIQNSSRPALAVQIDDSLFVAIRTDAGWLRSEEAIEQMFRLTAHRVLDTSSLTDAPSFGAITSSYDGGSMMGTEVRTLTILKPTPTGLSTVASIQLGQFSWILEAEDRRKYPKAASSLDARPHVEVQLVPVITNGVLTLRVERDVIAKQLTGRCDPAIEPEMPACTRVAMKARAGNYRLTAEGFTRVK